MDNVETAIIASSLETIDRIGLTQQRFQVKEIQDVRSTKVNAVMIRAKDLLLDMVNTGDAATKTVIEGQKRANRWHSKELPRPNMWVKCGI